MRPVEAVRDVISEKVAEDSTEGVVIGLVPSVNVASDVTVLVTDDVAVTDGLELTLSVVVDEGELDAVVNVLAVLL